ncbi:MAG: sugar phosphate isomerase/epimerase family protein, partial [Pyrinomonadaceae bacterium]
MDRRKFMQGLGALAGTTLMAGQNLEANTSSYAAYKKIKFGYAAITWGGNDLQAIKDISELGFKGIQFRVSIFNAYKQRPQELRDLLAQYKLEFVALSSGSPSLDQNKREEEINRQIEHAKFMRDAGGHYLQLTDAARPKTGNPEHDDYRKLGTLLSEIGKRVADFGIQVGYHNHMGGLGERAEEVDQILEASDPQYVKLELDSAHYLQGGGDPAAAVRKYKD